MNTENPERTRTLRVEIPADLETIYANIARISHSPAEIVLDFARMLPGQKDLKILNRIIMSPIGAKLFYRALGENLARYEASFGEIQLPVNSSLANSLFRNIQPPENSTDMPEDERPT